MVSLDFLWHKDNEIESKTNFILNNEENEIDIDKNILEKAKLEILNYFSITYVVLDHFGYIFIFIYGFFLSMTNI